MPEEREAPQQVDDHHHGVLKNLKHHLIEWQFFTFNKLIGAVGYPEMGSMDHEKNKDQRAQQAHAAAVPFAFFRMFNVTVFYRTCATILFPQQKAIDNMNQEANDQANLQGADDWICAHEMSVIAECCSAIIIKNHGVDGAMYDQKADQEQTRQRH
mgnify:CR=1 FL=1